MMRVYSIQDVRDSDKNQKLGLPKGSDEKLYTGNEVLRLRLLKYMYNHKRLVDGGNYGPQEGEKPLPVSQEWPKLSGAPVVKEETPTSQMSYDVVKVTAEGPSTKAPKPTRLWTKNPLDNGAVVCNGCGTYSHPINKEERDDYRMVFIYGYCTNCANHVLTCMKPGCEDCRNVVTAFYVHIEHRKERDNEAKHE